MNLFLSYIIKKQFILILVFCSLIVTGCNQKNEAKKKKAVGLSSSEYQHNEIPNISLDKTLLKYDKNTSMYLLDNTPFSGYMVSYYQDGILKEKIGLHNGKKQNEATYWYPDGTLKRISNYHEGRLHGTKKMWSNEFGYTLIAHFNFDNGKAHGEQKQWYNTGELYKKLNLNMGKEEGIQQAFRKNGDLYANYEAKNGRIFGLKKAALCYGLEDEIIKK